MEFRGLSQEASAQGALTQGVPSPADSPLWASLDKGGELEEGAWRRLGLVPSVWARPAGQGGLRGNRRQGPGSWLLTPGLTWARPPLPSWLCWEGVAPPCAHLPAAPHGGRAAHPLPREPGGAMGDPGGWLRCLPGRMASEPRPDGRGEQACRAGPCRRRGEPVWRRGPSDWRVASAGVGWGGVQPGGRGLMEAGQRKDVFPRGFPQVRGQSAFPLQRLAGRPLRSARRR